jgi:hypothetical protein
MLDAVMIQLKQFLTNIILTKVNLGAFRTGFPEKNVAAIIISIVEFIIC